MGQKHTIPPTLWLNLRVIVFNYRDMRQIAVFVPIEHAWTHPILQGIADYSPRTPWETFLPPTRPQDVALWLQQWTGHGIITAISEPASIRLVKARKLPAVNVAGSLPTLDFPSVLTDDVLVGQMAADHFLERGFDHVAFCGQTSPLSVGRRDALRDRYRSKRPRSTFHELPSLAEATGPWITRVARWRSMLRSLPLPLGVFCHGDEDAHMLAVAAGRAGLLVPDQLAILGAGNIAFRCELSNPPLSSIDLNVRHRGYEAAALLDRILDGRPAPRPANPIRVPPVGIVLRQSTDTVAVGDLLVASAIRHIRQNTAGITPDSLAADLAISRRTMERRFRDSLREGVSQVIWRERVRLATALLTTTRLSCYDIAERCGFSSASSLATVYRAHTGRSPSAVRDAARTPT